MATKYQFSKEEIEQIRNARKSNKSKQVERRLRVLEMMIEGRKNKEISEATGYHESYLKKLVLKYRKDGLGALTDNHYYGNHRNLSYEEETALLDVFHKRAVAGKMVSTSEIKAAYEEAVFASLDKVVDRLCSTICNLTAETVHSITARSWIMDCFN